MSLFFLSLLAACTPTADDKLGDSADSAVDSASPDDSATDDTAADDSGADDSAADDSGATGDSGDSGADDSGATDDSGAEPAAIEDIRAAVQAWLEADHSAGPRTLIAGLPDGALLDPREGQPDRESVPAQVLAAFDKAAQVEAAGEGAARLDQGTVDTYEVYAVTTSTDGDDAYIEVWTPDERLVLGARFYAAETPAWDAFDGRVWLAERFTTVDGPAWEEGYSEAAERAAAGQPAQDWVGDVQVLSGSIPQAGSLMGAVDFDGLAMTDVQRDTAVAAFDFIWGVHLRYTVNGSGPVTLGPQAQGVLVVGEFTRSTDGQTYLVADWRDIDDGSFVLYFEAIGDDLALRTIQYDN